MVVKKELTVGSKVRLNISALELIGWEGLTPNDNFDEIDYQSYIIENEDKVYTISKVDTDMTAPFFLKDDLLGKTSFSSKELIHVEEEVGLIPDEVILLTPQNEKEVIEKLNEFAKKDLVYTHDWLRFADKKPFKRLKELTFKDYSKYELPAGLFWQRGNCVGLPCIELHQYVHPSLIFNIKYYQMLIFESGTLRVVDTELSSDTVDYKSCVCLYVQK